jgi:hypothetical protein
MEARSGAHHFAREMTECGVVIAQGGPNIAAVALANKNARVLWESLQQGEDYRHRAAA